MRRSLLTFTSWLAAPVGAFAAPPTADLPPPADPVARVPVTPLPEAEAARRDALTRYGLGLLRGHTEQPVQAAKQLRLAADQDPTAAAPQKELAKRYAELGRDPAAIRAGEKAIAADPQDHDTARLLGRLYADANRPADAARVLRLAADAKGLTDPVAKLTVLRELATAADAANALAAAETARREALKLIADAKPTLLHPDLFTPVELDRERAKLYEGLGHALVKRKEFAPAAAAYRTARDLYADPKAANDPAGAARLHWNLSGSLAAANDPAAALKELEAYLALRPAAFAPYERLVELYGKLNRAKELPGVLNKLAEDNPKNAAPQWLAAASYLRAEPAVATAEFRKLLPTGKTADPFRVMVSAYREADRPKDLLDLLDRVYKAARPEGFDDPDRDPKKEPLPPPADAVERARLLTAAVKAVPPKLGFTKALVRQLAGDDRDGTRTTDALELVCGLARRDGSLEQLTAVLLATAERRKTDYRLKWLVVNALHAQRRWSDLVNQADDLSKAGKVWYPGIAAQVAVGYAELGRREAALRKLDDIGQTPYVQTQRARVLNTLDQPDEALKVCEAELTNDRLTAAEVRAIKTVQADTLNQMRKFAESEAIYRSLLDDDPDDVLILNNLGYNLSDQGRKLEEAEALLRRAIELDKFERTKRGEPEAESGGYADSLGWVLFRRGKLPEARALLEKATASPESAADAIVWDHLGDVAFRQGDKRRAAEAWAKAGELYAGTHLGRQNGRADEVKRKRKLAE